MSSATPSTASEYWDRYRPYRGEGAQPRPAAARFEWTDVPGHGPGAEVLGSPGTALDLGPAEGENAAVLAHAGTAVTAVDFSPSQVDRARQFWKDADSLDFVLAEACTFLDNDPRSWDAIYSTWGAVWFTDPDDLFPRIARRLASGGVFAFSHRAPATGEYGAQAMGGPWLEGRQDELTVHRWQYTTDQWSDILKRTGFANVQAQVLRHPEPDRPGTLLVQARTGS
ncbi:class I SAM-dependent methyltransferase [Streptomyces tauricus]|uniref:Class I SAM-dependent methyltransferase n=1 Tax=Streptomyces tauricus TaxID=68274 RepID=A0ABZ1JBN8_9ACTN|nr:class I SAM-dependent methyltransferase [Streptomyces tauricus]